jgi:hypothetical protein
LNAFSAWSRATGSSKHASVSRSITCTEIVSAAGSQSSVT